MDYSGDTAIIGTVISGVGGLAVGSGLGYVAGKRASKKSKSRKKSKRGNTRKRSNTHKKSKNGRRKTPHTAGKRKDTSHKRIRYTKNGQPYIIKGDGRARFISMKSAKSSHKRKGGKY